MAPQEKIDEETVTLSVQSDFGFPNEHLGRLSQKQEANLEEFKRMLIAEGLYAPAIDGKCPSHNDAMLLRFLRARRFVPTDAFQQFKETEQWRRINDLDNIYLDIDVDDYDESRRYYTHSIGRRDKRGMPIYLFRIGALDSKAMSAYMSSTTQVRLAKPENAVGDPALESSNSNVMKETMAPKLLRLCAIYENLAGWMTQLCTVLTDRPNPEVPITQSNNIVDISNVGLKQFWSLRGHMQDATILASAHYPETLDRIFIVGAPSFFPMVWSWIKGLFDPITTSKIFILSGDQTFSVLTQYIEPENIPKRYGGLLEFEFGDMPNIDPAYADRLVWKDDGSSGIKNANGELRRWPRGPVQWIARSDGDWDLLAVGSVDGKPRRDVLATFAVGENRGGWADKSVPHPKHDHAESPISAVPTVGSMASMPKNSALPLTEDTTGTHLQNAAVR